jgi:hypothetical protein
MAPAGFLQKKVGDSFPGIEILKIEGVSFE